MDPITAAVLGVAPALASDLVSDAVKSAYAGVKEIIRRKWGESSPIEHAVEAVEANPESRGKAMVLEEEVTKADAQADVELMGAVQRLVDKLKEEKVGGEAIAGIQITMSGGTVQGVVGAKRVDVHTMNFGHRPSGRTDPS